MTEVIVAVDGGGSKTRAVSLTADGHLVGVGEGPASSPQLVGVPGSLDIVIRTIRQSLPRGTTRVARAHLYLAGLDLDRQLREYRDAVSIGDLADAAVVVENDVFALLRAGTDSSDAVAVVCGTGINAVGVRSDGRTARFSALGPLSGDWGGGKGLGEVALWHAARAEDGRGAPTLLRDAILEVFGARSIEDLVAELYLGDRDQLELAQLAPAVFTAARHGDAVAQSMVDRQGDEIVALARAGARRLGLVDRHFPIVLGGGVILGGDVRLLERIHRGIATELPSAVTVISHQAPVLGGALLALEGAGRAAPAIATARAELSALEHGAAFRPEALL